MSSTMVVDSVSCASPSYCVAVGDPSSHSFTPSAEVISGSSVSVESMPSEAGGENDLFAVSCQSTDMCVAVGGVFAEERHSIPLNELWNGTDWSLLSHQSASNWTSITCRGTSVCTAIGYVRAAELIGSSWRPLPVEQPKGVFTLMGIRCLATTKCVAVGVTQETDGAEEGVIEWWNGHRFDLNSELGASHPDSELASVACPTASF